MVVHWDGKILPDLSGRNKIDRIAVLISYGGTVKFLGAPKIESGTGQNIADAVYGVLVEWGIADKVVASCFDTTSTNTGLNGGACFYLDQLLGRKLIQFACRHHTHEIALKNVFEKKYGASSAPEPLIFNRFAKQWDEIKHNQINSGFNDEIVKSKISQDECEQIKHFCLNQLKHKQIRDDYKELLQLSISFLGGDGGDFYTCGSTSHARFMSKCIYCLKIFLFRNHFKLTKKELNSVRDISIFIVKLYIKYWYSCTNPIKAPNQDLNFICEAFEYEETDKIISGAIIEKLKNHLWYLTPGPAGLGFFDSNVSLEVKRKMVNRLNAMNPAVVFSNYRKHSDPKELVKCDLSDFISHKTKVFFSNFNISTDFFDIDPSDWENDDDYQSAFEFCQNLFVVNDAAERGVKFMKDYNRVLTRDEEEFQLILKIVDQYRKKFPSHKKSILFAQSQGELSQIV